jgi:putative CocE/NonD family hydrolase
MLLLSHMRVDAQPTRARVAPAWTLPPKCAFQAIENLWIPMSDGVRLSARIWLPDGAQRTPVPVILESTPYDKRVRVRHTRAGWAAQIVPYGFGYVVPDLRGSGASGGVLRDEYLQQEQQDNVEIIAWLARQPWCDGTVGMRGVSWGGFGALQTAALRPPALKAIVVQCASDNRYTDDAHYIGGCVAMDGGEWAGDFTLDRIMAPDPEIVGQEHWRRQWQERLEAATPSWAAWLAHPSYDAFWQQGSVATDYSRIQCPVYAVDGQVDSYRDFVVRLLARLDVPRMGLVGPWAHMPPHVANPGPGLDWAPEEIRWWCHWLKREETGLLDEPMLRVFMEEKTAPEVWPKDVPGRWVGESSWPSAHIESRQWFLNPEGLGCSASATATRDIHSVESLGLGKREWYVLSPGVDLAPEQTPDDNKSLIFDSAPLTEAIEIVGNPHVTLHLSSNRPMAHVAVRLNEVTADGHAWNVSYGVLNLTHRDGHEHPESLVPGTDYTVTVSCYFASHRFKKGSRIRVALSESLWPLVWPSPEPVTLSVRLGASSLTLPVRPIESAPLPMSIPLLRDRVTDASDPTTRVTTSGPDSTGKIAVHKQFRDGVDTIDDVGITIADGGDWYLTVIDGQPNSTRWLFEWYRTTRRGRWDTKVKSVLEMTSTPTTFEVTESIHAWELGKEVFTRTWKNSIQRDLV